jgi:hypothetical protein
MNKYKVGQKLQWKHSNKYISKITKVINTQDIGYMYNLETYNDEGKVIDEVVYSEDFICKDFVEI